MIQYILIGFLTKIITGVDDTLTQIPLISNFTRTKKGKIAYSIGIIIAISLAILLSVAFHQILIKIPNYRYFAAGLIFLLAVVIYFDLFKTKEDGKEKIEKIKKLRKIKPISKKRFFKLMFIGFIASFATIIDDTIAFSSILFQNQIFVILGIFIAALTEIFLILTFSKQINKLKYKKEISAIGLIILSILVFLGII